MKLSSQERDSLISFRRHLHQHPKASGEERQTRDAIKKWLNQRTQFNLMEVGKNGLLLKGPDAPSGKKILVRVDIDALPITEKNEHLEYRSQNDGEAHLCGHDGHTAIGCGLALLLEKSTNSVAADIIFQPAEETGRGAQTVLDDPGFNVSDYNYSVALHNLPGYKKNSVVLRHDFFTAAVDSLIFKFTGSTSHAAEPEFGKNPSQAIAHLILECPNIVEEFKKRGFTVITPIYTRIGKKAYGTSPGYGESHFTLRAGKNKLLDDISETVKGAANKQAEKFNLKLAVESTESFRAVKNSSLVVDTIEKTAKEKQLEVVFRDKPFSWGEDFGRFTEKIPGAMFGLGSGEKHPVLHSENYDFPDELIQTGAELFYSIINNLENV